MDGAALRSVAEAAVSELAALRFEDERQRRQRRAELEADLAHAAEFAAG